MLHGGAPRIARMHHLAAVSIVLAGCLLAAGPAARVLAADTTVYECVGADGRAVFQDSPCGAGLRQRTLAVPDMPSRSPPPPVPRAPPPPPADDGPAAAAPEPAAPLPVMYACTRATDGKTYLSDHGDPAPYLAPYGVLGAEQLPLSEVYGPDRGGAGMSAPEANRGRVTAGLVANNYVWVQDSCRELDPAQTCQALQDAYDENDHQLRNAFKSQRPPLERREAQLRAQLASCD
jgi:hypothetical protein